MLGDLAGKKVLDLACGSGIQMAKVVSGCAEITGVDISEDLLAIARKRLEELPSRNWRVVSANADRLPFGDSSFNLVYTLGLLDYVEDPAAVLSECRRILYDDGALIFTMPKSPSPFSFLRRGLGLWMRKTIFGLPPILNVKTKAELFRLVESAGLVVEDVKLIWQAMWIVKAKRATSRQLRPIRVCVLTSHNHYYANLMIKKILTHFKEDSFVIVESAALLSGYSKLGALLRYFKISGARYVFSQIFKSIFNTAMIFFSRLFCLKNHRYYSYKFLNFPNVEMMKKSANVNSRQFLEWLSHDARPDLILSVYFNQILKNEIINQPALGTYNLHPALLPSYRGISPVFWALAKGEEKAGATLHKIIPKIDAGEILGQKEVSILDNDTEHSLYVRCTEAGFDLLVDFIQQLKSGIAPALVQPKILKESYFSLPTKGAVREFAGRGRKFWKFKELIGLE